MLACHSIRFFHLLSSTQQPPSPPPSPPSFTFSHKPDQEPQQLTPAFISTTIETTKISEFPPSPTLSFFSIVDIDMPATPKAAVIANGQKIAAAASPAVSPAGSVARPSPSSAGMSTPAEVPSTPLSKNQKKKARIARAAAAATITPAPVATAAGSLPSTPVATVKQQRSSASTTQQITPTVESLGLSGEEKTPVKASPIARNIFDSAATPTKKETVVQPKPVAHTFRWKNGGDIVKVTGTFDNWGESIVLKKARGNQDQFEVVVDLDRTQKILFKFIVDGQWRCTDEFPTEYDSIGNLNNVLSALHA